MFHITIFFMIQAAVWNTDNLSTCRKLQGHHHDVVACDFSPDSATLATASYDTRVIIWDPYTGDALKELGSVLAISQSNILHTVAYPETLSCSHKVQVCILRSNTIDQLE